MSNIITEGFAAYGLDTALTGSDTVSRNMLSGAWGDSANTGGANTTSIGQLPWDLANLDLYLGSQFGVPGASTYTGWRRVLPASNDEVFFSFYYAVNQLPAASPISILSLNKASNANMAQLKLQTTGALLVTDAAGAALASSSGPVVLAESALHLECRVKMSTGVFQVYADSELVIDATGLSFTSAADIAQFRVFDPLNLYFGSGIQYMSHLIVRDVNGDTNNTFPIGDRKVATLTLNRDDADHQGWQAEPIHRFGVGVLSLAVLTSGGNIQLSAVTGPGTSATDFGAGEFTIEGQFRFKTPPSGANKSVLFGKWDESANKRSYQLYLGGPSLENGYLVFRTSTDGMNGTVVEKLKWPWAPNPGQWYHVAMVRSSGELMLFIDGIMQGIPVADSDAYYAGTELPCLGAQMQSTPSVAVIANTNFTGYMDEFRLSVGFARYTANFAPPTEGFPRGGDDPQWGSVAWLSSFDNAVIADDGPNGIALVARNGAIALTPNDGAFAYQTINELVPNDDNFIEAALLPATGLFTLSAVPAPSETVRLGTKDGSIAATYTFVSALTTAFDVLIGASIVDTITNLVNAIINGDGEGTTYGTGTTANADSDATVMPTGQLLATALISGTGGNAVITTDTVANGSWAHGTLTGGVDIPDYSQFSWSRLPSNTSVVDSFTIVARQWRTSAGLASSQISFVGGGGEVALGDERALSSTPTLTFDLFEEDPDTEGGLTPTAILLSKVRVDRTL